MIGRKGNSRHGIVPRIDHRHAGVGVVGEIPGDHGELMHLGGGGDENIVGREGAADGKFGGGFGDHLIDDEQAIPETREQTFAIPMVQQIRESGVALLHPAHPDAYFQQGDDAQESRYANGALLPRDHSGIRLGSFAEFGKQRWYPRETRNSRELHRMGMIGFTFREREITVRRRWIAEHFQKRFRLFGGFYLELAGNKIGQSGGERFVFIHRAVAGLAAEVVG
jgi:hypothetical protein